MCAFYFFRIGRSKCLGAWWLGGVMKKELKEKFEGWVRGTFQCSPGSFSIDKNGEYSWYVYDASPGDIMARQIWVQGLWLAYQEGMKNAKN